MRSPFEFDLAVPERGARGRIKVIHRQLKQAILSGRIGKAHRLPSARDLAVFCGLSRNSVTTLYELLQAEGLIAAKRGSGYFVVDVLPDEAAAGRAVADRAKPPAAFSALGEPPKLFFSGASPSAKFDFQLGLPERPQGGFLETWRSLSARALRALTKNPPFYGRPEGEAELRSAVAAHVSATRAVVCEPEDIVITAGAQQAFDLIARCLVTPAETVVAVENPGYPPPIALFRTLGAKVVPVPVDGEGLRVELLPEDAKIIYVTPAHQFPMGGILSLERRKALLSFAHERGAVVIEDDYDGEFRFDRRPLDALQMLDDGRSVLFVGTFSKTLFPGLRLGFVIAPRWCRGHLIARKQESDRHCDLLGQHTLAAFIREGHMGRHVRRMRDLYAERRALIEEGLDGPLARWLERVPGSAGLHVAAYLRRPADDLALVKWLRTMGIHCEALGAYALAPGGRPGLAFGYGAITAERIAEGLRLLEGELEGKG